jgi:ABC-2 type transport system ATP-binding protein
MIDMDAIRCEGLSRKYGSVEALKSLDLNISAGSVFGFLGRNGAGKTTTIRLMTGLGRPSSGTAWINGVKITHGDGSARMTFGYLPEEPAFYGWMTPWDFMNYVGKIFGLNETERHQRIEELLDLTDLQHAAKRRIGGFSRGMRQRLGLAQALIHKPPVLLLDEPTSALDPAGRRDVLALISRLRGQTTVFLSSHILADVERVCDTIGVIHEGQLLLVSGRDDLLSRYAANVVVLEFAQDSLSASNSLITLLQQQSWITAVSEEGNIIRLSVRDASQARQKLLPLIVQVNPALRRYEWVRPTLEDVFLSISAS